MKQLFRVISLATALAGLALPALAQTAMLTWQAPTTAQVGASLAGYYGSATVTDSHKIVFDSRDALSMLQQGAFPGSAPPVGATAPLAPTASATGANNSAIISYTDGSNGGASITSHNLYASTTSGAESLFTSFTSSSPYTANGLTNGQTYYLQLAGVNLIGAGAKSGEFSVVPNNPVIVSMSNRAQLGRNIAGNVNTTQDRYFVDDSVHTPSATGAPQPYYCAVTESNANELPAANPLILRGAYYTNLQGTAGIGTTGVSLNQTGATVTGFTWTGVVNGTTVLYGDSTGANMGQTRTYAQFLAAGGSISQTTIAGDTITEPVGWCAAPDPGPAVAAGTPYMLRTEEYVPINATALINAVGWYGTSKSPSRLNVNSTGDYTKQYSVAAGAGPTVFAHSLQMVLDPNWSSGYSGITGGTTNGVGPAWVQGVSYGGPKTTVIGHTSVAAGNFDYGDTSGTEGPMQRALFSLGNHPFASIAVVGTSITLMKEAAGFNLRDRVLKIFTASGGDYLGDDGRNDVGLPITAGVYPAASPNNTADPTSLIAGIRWEAIYHIRPNLGVGSKYIRFSTITPGTTGGALGVAATTTSALTVGQVVTFGTAATSKLINGETVDLQGFTGGTNFTNAKVCVVGTIVTNTSFACTFTGTAPTGTPSVFGTVNDGGQNVLSNPANTATTYTAGGNGTLMNDYTMGRNGFAGQSTNPNFSVANGDFDGAIDANALTPTSQAGTGHPELWAAASEYKAMAEEFVHPGWQPNQAAATAIAPIIAGVLGY